MAFVFSIHLLGDNVNELLDEENRIIETAYLLLTGKISKEELIERYSYDKDVREKLGISKAKKIG